MSEPQRDDVAGNPQGKDDTHAAVTENGAKGGAQRGHRHIVHRHRLFARMH
ncbi:MAG TPA: hypothetical protein VMH32_17270 [Burkholderiales bacterium]|nr:hypothetical protein [Burkholderiales bacterium]